MPDHEPGWDRHRPSPGGFQRGRRPPWWPEDEPSPDWRGRGRRFPRRVGLAVALFLGFFFVASGLVWRWFGGGGGFGREAAARLVGTAVRADPPRAAGGGVPGRAGGTAAGGAHRRGHGGRRPGRRRDYATRVQVTGPGEVARLASSFNQMTERLQANEAQRRALLADVTHELRTPLSVIRGNIEGMLDGVYPPDEAHLGPVLEETAVMARLLDDLQTLSTAEAGCCACTASGRPGRPGSGRGGGVPGQGRPVRVELECRAAGPSPRSTSTRCGSARSWPTSSPTRSGTRRGGSVRVAVEAVPDGVAFTVSDTGPGIAASDLPHVFGGFVKSADSGGAGLGLAIAEVWSRPTAAGSPPRALPGRGP